MVMPETGYLIANAFNRVVVYISTKQSLTYYPHQKVQNFEEENRFICFAFIKECHFIKLTLVESRPIPPVASFWLKFATSDAKRWSELFVDRQIEFINLRPIEMAVKDGFEF